MRSPILKLLHPMVRGLLLLALAACFPASISVGQQRETDALTSSGHATTFSGQATGINATVLGINTVIADTGPLPSSGGALQASLLTASVPGLLTADVLHATTIGQANESSSEASVADLSLTVAGNTIAASFLMSQAVAACTGTSPSVSGSSELADLAINGQQISVSGQPNQTIALPNGDVVINEQQTSVSGNTGSTTVNALHIVVNGIADIVVSSAHADITCQAPPVCGSDFVTGGGWITGTPSGQKGNFGVAGGIKNGAFWGHLEYIDHGPGGPTVHGTGVTAYVVVNATTRHIEGTAQVNGQSGFTYGVDVADNGEPGTNDTFKIALSNGYVASATLGGGNIKLHPPCE